MLFFCPVGDTKSLKDLLSEFGIIAVSIPSALYKLQCLSISVRQFSLPQRAEGLSSGSHVVFVIVMPSKIVFSKRQHDFKTLNLSSEQLRILG